MPILGAGPDLGRSLPQVRRLYAIAYRHGVMPDDVRELLEQYHVDDARELTREDYDALCDSVLPGMTEVLGDYEPQERDWDAVMDERRERQMESK